MRQPAACWPTCTCTAQHSWDCTTPIDELLDSALAAGLGALAVTDHNTIAGGVEARARAIERGLPLHVIVGSEIKTATDGEVIGLFLHEEMPRGLTFAETIERIRAQGGVVYVPHPFDRFHTTPSRRAAARARGRDRRRRDGQRPALARARQPRAPSASRASTACAAERARTPTCPGASARARCAWRRSTTRSRSCAPSMTPRSCGEPRSMLRLQVEKRRRQRARRAAHRVPSPAGDRRDRPGSGRTPTRCPPTSSTSVTWRVRSARSTHSATRSPAAATLPRASPCSGSGHPLGDIFLLKHDPTPAELTEGVAFYGRVGQAVLKSVQRLDIDPLLVYGTNVVKLGGDHGRDESELAERVYPMWLLRELHIVQPKIVVVMGEDTLAVVNGLDLALAKPLEPELGVVQHLTPTIEALFTPPLEPSLDDAAAKRRFWAAFRALGEWYAALPPY